jgi:L-ascorbate metabolism protein UlaG (beta-lactamase superfamily)
VKIHRMQRAGVVIEGKDTVVMIDPVYDSPNVSFFGKPLEPFVNLSSFPKPDVIAVTHFHSDHFDANAIMQCFGAEIPLLVPKKNKKQAMMFGFKNVIGLEAGESYTKDAVAIHAAPAVDGLGDPQVSWVVRIGDKMILHGGDTLWHGYWWKRHDEFGPIDVAFLPINGAVVKEEGITYSNQPICMTPEQSVTAAKLLQARLTVPIHYGAFHNPPIYLETSQALERFIEHARLQEVEVRVRKNKEELLLTALK